MEERDSWATERRMREGLQALIRRVRTRSGISLVEYGLILFLVSIVAVLVLRGIGVSTNNTVSAVNNGFPQ